LSVAGGIFQVTLRNPLADPLLLGVAAGASLAASIAIGLGASGAAVPAIAATAGAGLTLVFVFGIAGRRGRFDPGTMVLAGVVASTFYSAITLFLLAVTPSRTTSQILQWTMGGFADPGFGKVRWAGPVLLALAAAAATGARPLNLLALGDDSARSSGLAVAPARALLYAIAAALTGVSVAAAGVIGFVGLVVPHLARMIVGPDQRVSLPASALLGAALCVGADAVARVAVPLAQTLWSLLHGAPVQSASMELPVGVVTALFGAPFFIALLVRRQARGESA
ncbi:MAG TPA: iron ABC transporter permease, partial [bacterium]|nr:iron ABC transporter permease [bacterium]